MAIILGPQDKAISLTMALPAAAANNTTGIIDLQAVGPFSDAWRLGLFAVTIPAIPAHTDSTKSITLELKAAPPSLTLSSPAPSMPVPGTFVTPINAQKISIAGVAATGSAAQTVYFYAALDANGSTFQFYQFLQTVPSGDNNAGEIITYQWMNA